MRIKVQFTLDIDPQAWADDYGISKDEVHKDVNEWAANLAYDAANMNGMVSR